jgi:hypothetical protein
MANARLVYGVNESIDHQRRVQFTLQQEIFISLLKTLAISLRGLHFKRTGSTRLKSF